MGERRQVDRRDVDAVPLLQMLRRRRMRCALHGQEQCPLCDPQPRRRRPPPPRLRTAPENMAVDAAGKSLPYTAEEVTRIMEKALRDGDVMAAILRMPTGDLAVQVFGPPSLELLDILETTARAYRRVLQGH